MRSIPNKMRAWAISEYGDYTKLRLHQELRTPHIAAPNLLLVKVKATSVNPIDIHVMSGYGKGAFNILRSSSQRFFQSKSSVAAVIRSTESFPFPLIPGRDFSGTVVDTSPGLTGFSVGQAVTGAVPPFLNGTLADYILVPADFVAKKPEEMSHNEAVSLGYASLTAYTALAEVARLKDAPPSRCLIVGASGGLGVTATQLCLAWGHDVTVTSSDSLVSQMQELGPSEVIPQSRWRELVAQRGAYDVVLDCVNAEPILTSHIGNRQLLQLRKSSNYARGPYYVSMHSALLHSIDARGAVMGGISAASNLLRKNVQISKDNKCPVSFLWAFFKPNGKNLQNLLDCVVGGQLTPFVNKVYDFSNEVPAAFEENSRARGPRWGKTIISWSDDKAADSDS